MSSLEIEKHAHGMGQDLANKPILEVPQIMHADTRYGKVLGELEADRFDDFAPASPCAYQAEWLGQRHTRPWRGDDVHPLVLRESGVLVLVNEAFVRGDEAPPYPVHQVASPWMS